RPSGNRTLDHFAVDISEHDHAVGEVGQPLDNPANAATGHRNLGELVMDLETKLIQPRALLGNHPANGWTKVGEMVTIWHSEERYLGAVGPLDRRRLDRADHNHCTYAALGQSNDKLPKRQRLVEQSQRLDRH